MSLWKHVECKLGNKHNVFSVLDLIMPYDCGGACTNREETNEQVREEFQKLYKEEIEEKSNQKENEITS